MDVKENCFSCGEFCPTPFCGNCGSNQKDAPAAIGDPNKWGPGSKAKKSCEIPIIRLEDGSDVDIVIGGKRYFGHMDLTWDEYDSVKSIASRRVWQDKASRHGNPEHPKLANNGVIYMKGNG